MSHYDALGVGKDATPEEIKKAYRQQSKKNHPDRGGDVGKMVAINKAYECLSNPAKREYYDLNGNDEPLATQDQKALSVIFQILMTLSEQAEEEFDFVEAIVQNLNNNIITIRRKEGMLQREIRKAEKQRKCIRRKSKGKENLLDQVFEQKISALNAQLLEIPRAVETAKKALEIMRDYESAVAIVASPRSRFEELTRGSKWTRY